jgi:hypothetical protein
VTPELSRQVGRHIDRGESELLAGLLFGLSEEERRDLMPFFTAEVRALRPSDHRKIGPLRVGGAACLPTAAQAAAWLNRSALRWWWSRGPDQVVNVLLGRGVAWLPDLATRVAAALPARPGHGEWSTAAELIKVSGAPVPTSDAFVRGWVEDWRFDPSPRVRLRADPFLDALLPRLFDVDGLGIALDVDGATALAAVATEGRIPRKVLLDGTVGRLLRGDRPAAVSSYVHLHKNLDPDVDEIEQRRLDYLRLLTVEQSTVVTLAQQALRRLDDAGRLDLDSLLDASRDVLVRREKALARAQLSWLDTAIRRHRDRTSDIVDVIADALASPHLDIADRATALLAKHGRKATVEPSPTDDLPGPQPQPVLAVPPPITTVAEFTAEVALLLTSQPDDPVVWERVLDGLARLAVQELRNLVEALRALLKEPYDGPERYGLTSPLLRLRWLLSSMAFSPGRRWTHHLGPGTGPTSVILARIHELAQRIGTLDSERLLATPTAVTGHLDLATLVDRLEELERSRAEPGPVDLAQALLRLPRDVDPEAAHRAKALVSPAGQSLRRWLNGGGLPDPQLTVHMARPTVWNRPASIPRHVVTIAGPAVDAGPVGQAMLGARPEAADQLGRFRKLWPAILPSHREVVAAYLLPSAIDCVEYGIRGGAEALPHWAETSGPTGPATTLCLAYGLGAKHAEDRTATIDAALLLAATGDLPATQLGVYIGGLCQAGTTKLTRVVTGLDEFARGGVAAATWQTIAAALPPLLGMPDPPRGLPDLLQLAARVTTPGAPFSGRAQLEALASRGTGRLGAEAQRLARSLGGAFPSTEDSRS